MTTNNYRRQAANTRAEQSATCTSPTQNSDKRLAMMQQYLTSVMGCDEKEMGCDKKEMGCDEKEKVGSTGQTPLTEGEYKLVCAVKSTSYPAQGVSESSETSRDDDATRIDGGPYVGVTEQECYLLLVCKAYDRGQRCQETDTCPLLTAVGIVSAEELSKRLSSSHPALFYLPLLVCHNEAWQSTLPRYENWMLSTAYFPSLQADKKTLCPGPGTVCPSAVDCFRVYASCIHSTLAEFWQTGSRQTASYVLLLRHTLSWFERRWHDQYPLHGRSQDRLQLLHKLDKCLKQRDVSLAAAREYVALERSTHPGEFYWALFNLLDQHTRQKVVGLWNLLYGVLTQHLLPSDVGVTCKGLQDHWLRLVWERIAPCVPEINYADCFTESDLIKAVHQRAGQRAENYLKHWSFVLSALDGVLCNPVFFGSSSSCTMTVPKLDRAVDRLVQLRDTYKQLSGLTAPSLMICPSLDRCLSDKSVAEVILSAASRTRKTEHILDVAALFDSHAATPLLDKVLAANLESVKRIQHAVNSVLDSSLSAGTPTCLDTTATVVGEQQPDKEKAEQSKTAQPRAKHVFAQFEPPSVRHVFASGNTVNFLCTLVSLLLHERKLKPCNRDVLEDWAARIFTLCDRASNTFLLGKRRLRTVLNLVLPAVSVLRTDPQLTSHHSTWMCNFPHISQHAVNNPAAWNKPLQYSWKFAQHSSVHPHQPRGIPRSIGNSSSESDTRIEDGDGTEEHQQQQEDQIEFLTVAEALLQVEAKREQLRLLNEEMDATCPVCLELYSDSAISWATEHNIPVNLGHCSTTTVEKNVSNDNNSGLDRNTSVSSSRRAEQDSQQQRNKIACHDRMHFVCTVCFESIVNRFKECPICRASLAPQR